MSGKFGLAVLGGALLAFSTFSSPVWANANIMFILDVSGSMAARLDGKRKINLAKRAFNDTVAELPAETHAGLYVYGHYGDKDCQAFEQKVALGTGNRDAMINEVKGLQAIKGATPLTAALMKSVEAVGNYEQPGQKSVVLLSDGIENCGGDPVDFAKWVGEKLKGMVKIYVVGFDVDDEGRKQLEAVANAGMGAYFDAANLDELAKALNKVTVEVAAAPEPKPEVKSSIFEDDFDAAFLKEDWTVIGDSPDERTLTDGKFVVITEAGSFAKENIKNALLYKAPIAEKNYDVSLSLDMDIQAYGNVYGDSPAVRTNAGIVLHQSKDFLISLHVASIKASYNTETGPYAIFVKRQKGKNSKALSAMLVGNAPRGPAKAHLRIEKRGFKYTGFYSLDGEKWSKLGTHALLGKKLTPGLYANQGKDAVESIVEFDRFEIQKVEK